MRRSKRYLKDLDADIRDHIERESQDNIDRGMPPDEARRAAMLRFGNIERIKEDARAVWTIVWLEQLLQDFRYAVRTLRRNPGFTAVVVLTLALGIGMNTAVFSIFNAVLLRPLPFPDPERLVWISTYEKEWNEEFVLDDDFRQWRDHAASFDNIAAYETRDVTLRIPGGTVRSRIALVSKGFWEIAGTVPALGRLPQDGQREVLLSHRFFKQFVNDPNAVGKVMAMDGQQPFTVAGVLPESAEFRLPGSSFSSLDTTEVSAYVPAADSELSSLNGVIARLKPDVSIESARAELAVIRTRKEESSRWDEWTEVRAIPLQDKIVGQARRPLWILMVAVGFVLLITCANVANVLLARASARHREIAVRASVGAGRMRVLRQFLAESALLAVLGGAAGFLVSGWTIRAIVGVFPDAVPRLGEATLSGTVLVFAAACSLLTAFVFGSAPAVSLWKLDLHSLLKDSTRSASATAASHRFRKVLVVAQHGLAAVLLSGAGLMIKSFWKMYAQPAGFHPERMVMMKASVSGPEYFANAARQRVYVEEALRRIKAVPGVTAASVLFRGTAQDTWEGAPPLPPGELPPVMIGTMASSAYRQILGLRLIKGRWFTDSDADPVLIINESLARRDFPGEDPIGKRLKSVGPVVGVVSDLKFSRLDAEPEPEFFTPYSAWAGRQARGDLNTTFLVQTEGDASAAAASIQKAVSDIDRAQAIYDVKTLERVLSDTIAPRRFNLYLLATFAAAALSLALIGIYGVTAYSVVQRTTEIGIRMALGAHRREVIHMVMRQGMKMAVAGVVLGIAAALALTRLVASLLYGVEPTDPATFIAATLALAVTSLIACWLPALRAALVDPLIALRHE